MEHGLYDELACMILKGLCITIKELSYDHF